ncbi:MAG: Uma2 family endonuclease [bacterium]|nr:Uma2 family endonuclease [bacterium]
MVRGIDEKPYLEWLDGVESLVVSPNPPHGIVAIEIGTILNRLGSAFGTSAVEVHLRLDDDAHHRTVLLPDVVFYRDETMLGIPQQDRMLPNVPPEIIVDVRSPNDRPGFREAKIARYVAWGCPLVLDVSVTPRAIVAITRDGARTYRPGDRFEHPAVPWLQFQVGEVFAKLDLFGF